MWSNGGMTHVEISPLSEDDLDLLRRANTPELMDQLGGRETDEQVIARHQRYLRLAEEGTGAQFRIEIPGHPEGVGLVGYWQRNEADGLVLEAGWSVEAPFRGRGIAPAAVVAMLESARAAGETMPVHAYPQVDNLASNAVCRKAGFTLVREVPFEIRPGHVLHLNDWVFDLTGLG